MQLDRRRDEITQSLAEIDAELIYNDLSIQKVNTYPVKVLRRKD